MGLTSPFTAGAQITAAALASLAPLGAYKYSDQNSGQSNTALVADTDLAIALLANGTYVGVGLIVFSAATAADYKATFTAPSGATGGWSPNVYLNTGNNVVSDAAFLAFGTTAAYGGQGTADNQSYLVTFSVVMGAVAGTLQWKFAQNSSDASNLNTRGGSFLLAWKIA